MNISDPFEALFMCEGNAALAAEQLGLTLPDFYRRLEASDPERVSRGVAVRLVVTLNSLVSALEGRLITRLNDTEEPLADKSLVDLLTKIVPALSELARSAGTPRGQNGGDGNGGGLSPEVAAILAKALRPVVDVPANLPTAGQIWNQES